MYHLSWLGGNFARKEVYEHMPGATTQLRQIRDSLGVTQETVARRTRSIGLRTYIRAEGGDRVTYDTANQILEAINSFLAEANRPSVTLDDLGLTLY